MSAAKLEEMFWTILLTLIGLHPVIACLALVGIAAIILVMNRAKWSARKKWIFACITTFVLASVYLLRPLAINVPPPIKITNIQAGPYIAGEKAAVNVWFNNESAFPLDLSGFSAVFVGQKLADTEKQREQEDKWWQDLMKSVRRIPGFAVPPGDHIFVTLSSNTVLTEEQANLLKTGKAAMYFMGVYWFSDVSGSPWRQEICGSYMTDQRFHFLCQKHNGPSRE